MEHAHKNCQSCGVPLKRDDHGGGTNADGTRSAMYCSHCYVGGKFTLPNITAQEMQERVKQKLREHKIPGFMAWVFTGRIPKLKRWNQTSV